MELAADSGVVPAAIDSDEVLWGRSLDGDGAAFRALFDRHRDRVFRQACRIAPPTRHDAEDVAASTFLELWRRRADVTLVDESVLPWLLVDGDQPSVAMSRVARAATASSWTGSHMRRSSLMSPRSRWMPTRSGSMRG